MAWLAGPLGPHPGASARENEEKIAQMLDQKKGLANLAYGDGEQWLTELADDELRALVELSDDAVEGEEA